MHAAGIDLYLFKLGFPDLVYLFPKISHDLIMTQSPELEPTCVHEYEIFFDIILIILPKDPPTFLDICPFSIMSPLKWNLATDVAFVT